MRLCHLGLATMLPLGVTACGRSGLDACLADGCSSDGGGASGSSSGSAIGSPNGGQEGSTADDAGDDGMMVAEGEGGTGSPNPSQCPPSPPDLCMPCESTGFSCQYPAGLDGQCFETYWCTYIQGSDSCGGPGDQLEWTGYAANCTCPSAEPIVGTACTDPGGSCTYPDDGGCGGTYCHCSEPSLTWACTQCVTGGG
jgi:hypothetical protein